MTPKKTLLQKIEEVAWAADSAIQLVLIIDRQNTEGLEGRIPGERIALADSTRKQLNEALAGLGKLIP